MEVRIGVRNVAREVTFESDQTAEQVHQLVDDAVAAGRPLHFVDDRGRHYLIPLEALGFVQIGGADKGRVGFGAS